MFQANNADQIILNMQMVTKGHQVLFYCNKDVQTFASHQVIYPHKSWGCSASYTALVNFE